MATDYVRVTTRACAKINLTLRVQGTRPDGYHQVRTTLQTLALHDTLTFEVRDGSFVIECDEPGCPVDRTNLIWRGTERMWRLAGHRGRLRGIGVRVAKRIPLRSGLGGGSSDAAATLDALNTIWQMGASRDDLRGVARELGADVPFFLEGGTALGIDRGDVLFPLPDWPLAWVALALPDFGVSTKGAYDWFDRDVRILRPRRIGRSAFGTPGRGWPKGVPIPREERGNDLQTAVAARHPAIGRLVRMMEQAGASYAAMSGSGSSVFGIFETRDGARTAAKRISGPGRRMLVTRTVSRSRYRAWSLPMSVAR